MLLRETARDNFVGLKWGEDCRSSSTCDVYIYSQGVRSARDWKRSVKSAAGSSLAAEY